VVDSAGIKFPETKISGVSLRSYKMKLPPSVGQKKTKAIDQLLEELQIDSRPIATETVCDQFNDLRSDIVLLYELQQALTNCEFELQSFRHRYEPILQSKNVDMSLFDVSLSSSTSSLISTLSNTAVNTPQKRISEIFEISLTPSSVPLVRITLN
jgi:DNA methyltransferase 1-associated protein 1